MVRSIKAAAWILMAQYPTMTAEKARELVTLHGTTDEALQQIAVQWVLQHTTKFIWKDETK